MKNTIYLFYFFMSSTAIVQAQNIPASPPGKGTSIDGKCMGLGGPCAASMSMLNARSSDNNATTFSIYKSKNNVVITYPKSLLDEEMTDLFKNKNAIYAEKEQQLDESVMLSLNLEKPLVLSKGWHVLIETEKEFIVSYSLKD